MNIFYLDNDIKKCAEYHVDKHVVKMITETAQILCSAYYFTGEEHMSPYKLTHKNHPCCVWVRQSLSNWLWLRDLGLALYDEYKYRYSKNHKAGEIIKLLNTPNLNDNGFTEPALAMDEKFKLNDAISSYRNYYNQDKKHLHKWKNRSVPEWII